MTIGFYITFNLAMPHWLDVTGIVSAEQWMDFNQCLSFAATLGLN